MPTEVNRQRMDEAVVALAQRGLFVTLKPGPSPDSDMRIHVKTIDGRMLCVLPDLHTPVLYEVFVLERHFGDLNGMLGDKLPLAAMAELVFAEVMK